MCYLDYQVQNDARTRLKSSLSTMPMAKYGDTSREDVQRQSLEQDRYYNRLNLMNNKQKQIFEKYLVEHLVPIKDKERQLEEIERK